MSDSFLNLEHLCAPSTARGTSSSHPRGKVVTSPSLSRLSRVAPEDAIIETGSSQPSTSRSSGEQNNRDTSRSDSNSGTGPRSSVHSSGQATSAESGSSSGRTSVEHLGRGSGVNPAAELSNVSTRDIRLGSNSSANSRNSASTDQGIGASVTGSVSDPLRESNSSSAFNVEISEDTRGVPTPSNETAVNVEVEPHGHVQGEIESADEASV